MRMRKRRDRSGLAGPIPPGPARIARLLMGAGVGIAALGVAVPDADAAVFSDPPDVPAWVWCAPHPDDPAAPAAVAALAREAGIDATFGPCMEPTGPYTPAFPADRYEDPSTYRRLVQLNASVGMDTVVYDARVWSPDPAVRQEAFEFWQPYLPHIAAWDLGDEFDPAGPEWAVLVERWNRVLADLTARTGVRPFTNHLYWALDEALRDLDGAGSALSFTYYPGDRGVAVALEHAPLVERLMCGVNAFTHGPFLPDAVSIEADMRVLQRAGCGQFLVFGGHRVYGTDAFGNASLTDEFGAATDWAAGADRGGVKLDTGVRPLVPARLLETRVAPGMVTVDGVAQGIGRVPAGGVADVLVAGRGGVPSDAEAVVLNVAVTEPAAGGFVTVFPCGAPLPLAASVNFARGATVSNGVVSKVGANGRVCLFSNVSADLVIDVNGYQPTGSRFGSVVPARLFDTRTGPESVTVDGRGRGGGAMTTGGVVEVPVADRGIAPLDADAVVLNVAVTEPAAPGFVTVFPCGTPLPVAASVNFVRGETVSNGVVAKVGLEGRVCVYSSAPAHLVVDLTGYHPAGSRYGPLVPARLLDTRSGPSTPTVDGLASGAGVLPPATVLEVPVAGRGGVPADAAAVSVNLAVTQPLTGGFVTVFPCGSPMPLAASLNFAAGETRSNGVLAKLGPAGSLCLYASTYTHLVLDVNGAHPPKAPDDPV
jgi:hypothetical protein